VHLVLPLLRDNFYVTESEPYRQVVFYYRFVQGLRECLTGVWGLKGL
jgi:hypothetical protein